MKKYYCDGKKGLCERDLDCGAHDGVEPCEFFNGKGGAYIEADSEEDDE